MYDDYPFTDHLNWITLAIFVIVFYHWMNPNEAFVWNSNNLHWISCIQSAIFNQTNKLLIVRRFLFIRMQHIGLDWLVTMHDRKLNGILADEMGLGKVISDTHKNQSNVSCSMCVNWNDFISFCRPFKRSRCWLIWHVSKAIGVHTWLWCHHPWCSIGKWNLRNGVQVSRSLPIMAHKKSERQSVSAGQKWMHFMCASHHTNWSYRIIKVFDEKSGNIWFWMKHRTSKISNHNDGNSCSISKLNSKYSNDDWHLNWEKIFIWSSINAFCCFSLTDVCCWRVHHCKTTWWSCGRLCIS